MPAVKGSQQETLVIRHYRPWERLRHLFYLVLFILAVGVGSYFAGLYGSMDTITALTQERETLSSSLEEAEFTISGLTQKVGVLEKGGEVDRMATEGIRQTVKDLKTQIATLEEEVSFYKGIMAPSGNDRGLRVSKAEISRLTEPRRYHYSIMMTQVADNSSYISGLAAVNFIGIKDGARVILPLRDFDASVTDLGVKFRFRYFQEVAGDITLPDQFIPSQVQVVLQSTGDKAQRVEHTIDWPR